MVPTQIIERLGIVWDAVSGTIRISNRRELSIAESVYRILLKDSRLGAGIIFPPSRRGNYLPSWVKLFPLGQLLETFPEL